FDVIVRDTIAPVGTLVISNGLPATRNRLVSLSLDFFDAVGAVTMRYSVDGGVTWSAWEGYARMKSVMLGGSDGRKTVVVQVADAAGNVGSASASILLDTTPPIVIVGVTQGTVCDICQTLTFSYTVTDAGGVGSVIS